jgi:hypothetical protein
VPKTVEAKLLLGWMPQQEALDFLLSKCVFDAPLQEADALAIWNSYRDKVTAIGKRACVIPALQKPSLREKMAIKKLKKNPPPMQDTLHDVVKIDPSALVIHQFYIVTDRSEDYLSKMRTETQRIKVCFGQDQQMPTVEDKGTTRIIKFPHFEYDVEQNTMPNGVIFQGRVE